MEHEKVLRTLWIAILRKDIPSVRAGRHTDIISRICENLRTNGFLVNPESSIHYLMGKNQNRRGNVDVFAQRKDMSIVVEYDNGNKLKRKSIQKLLSSNVDVRLGVVIGSFTGNKTPRELNRSRIQEVLKETDDLVVGGCIYLMIIRSEELFKVRIVRSGQEVDCVFERIQ